MAAPSRHRAICGAASVAAMHTGGVRTARRTIYVTLPGGPSHFILHRHTGSSNMPIRSYGTGMRHSILSSANPMEVQP